MSKNISARLFRCASCLIFGRVAVVCWDPEVLVLDVSLRQMRKTRHGLMDGARTKPVLAFHYHYMYESKSSFSHLSLSASAD